MDDFEGTLPVWMQHESADTLYMDVKFAVKETLTDVKKGASFVTESLKKTISSCFAKRSENDAPWVQWMKMHNLGKLMKPFQQQDLGTRCELWPSITYEMLREMNATIGDSMAFIKAVQDQAQEE